VPLGPHNVVWSKLYQALAGLAAACGGAFAFVIDEGNGLWCVGLPHSTPTTATTQEDRAADRFYKSEIVPRLPGLRRGSRLDIVKIDGDDRYAAVSFAGIYAVVVWFEAAFEPGLVRGEFAVRCPKSRLSL
jgi:hypothetical protein